MLVYAIKRTALAAVIITAATALLFAMLRLIPGDPARVALGPRASQAMLEQVRVDMGLDLPLLHQFARFMGNLLQGDLGMEVVSNRAVTTILLEQAPYTLALLATGLAWAVILGVPLGVFAAAREGRLMDHLVGIISVSLIAVPAFVIAIYALLLFAVHLQWLPAVGAGESGNIGSQIRHLILPSLAVGLGWIGYLARMVRASMLEVLAEPHIRTARGLGLPARTILFTYALRIAVLPTITLLGVGVAHLISSAVFVEIVFARPGVGKLVYDAILGRNIPLVTGGLLLTTVFYVLANLVADLLIGVLDPRVRSSFNKT